MEIIVPVGVVGLSVFILWKFKDEINEIGKNLISQIGEYNRELTALIISAILITLLIVAFKRYKKHQIQILDNYVQDVYQEMEEELTDNFQEENMEGPIIDLEGKINDYCKKRKIDKKMKENILIKLNDLINDENSSLKKHFIYIDGKIISYVKLKNQIICN